MWTFLTDTPSVLHLEILTLKFVQMDLINLLWKDIFFVILQYINYLKNIYVILILINTNFFDFSSSYFCRNNSGWCEIFARYWMQLWGATVFNALAIELSFWSFSKYLSGANSELEKIIFVLYNIFYIYTYVIKIFV